MTTNLSLKNLLQNLDALWNRGVTGDAHISLALRWPLLLVPIVLLNQLLTPHPVWIAVLVTLLGLYALAYFWVRIQVDGVQMQRDRDERLLAAGDRLHERFVLTNDSPLPLLWVEFRDLSQLPGYTSSQVVACSANSSYTWQSSLECKRRGVYQLGPAHLIWNDPFGIFTVEKQLPQTETILIYPRVAQLPEFHLPQGATSSSRQRQRPLLGALRSTSVREYQPGDSLRHVHWRSTAHRNSLMVTELDMEPGGEIWIVLDLNEDVHSAATSVSLSDTGETDTLEYSIVVAASLAAQILNRHDRTAVGLIAATRPSQVLPHAPDERAYVPLDSAPGLPGAPSAPSVQAEVEMVVVSPQTGPAQLWRILAALAPVQATHLSLAQLLRTNREQLGRGRTVALITPDISAPNRKSIEAKSPPSGISSVGPAASSGQSRAGQSPAKQSHPAPSHVVETQTTKNDGDLDRNLGDMFATENSWVAEMVHLQGQATGGVFLIAAGEEPKNENEAGPENRSPVHRTTPTHASAYSPAPSMIYRLQALLTKLDISARVLHTATPLPSLLTRRRTRRVIRSTPNGGAIMMEIEEEAE